MGLVDVREGQQEGDSCAVEIQVHAHTIRVEFDLDRLRRDAISYTVQMHPDVPSPTRRRALLKRAAGAANDERHECFRRRQPERLLVMAYAYGCLAAAQAQVALSDVE